MTPLLALLLALSPVSQAAPAEPASSETRQFGVGGYIYHCSNTAIENTCTRDWGARCHQRVGYIISNNTPLCGELNCDCEAIIVCEICKGGEDGVGGTSEVDSNAAGVVE